MLYLYELIEWSMSKKELLNAMERAFNPSPDTEGNTPLHYLASADFRSYKEKDEEELLDKLLIHSPDLNATNQKGETVFDMAVKNQRLNLALILLKRGATISNTAVAVNGLFASLYQLRLIIEQMNPEEAEIKNVQRLLEALFAKVDLTSIDEKGNNLLQLAIIENPLPNLLSELLQRDVNVHHRNNEGFTALQLAAKHNLIETVLLLLQHDASCDSIPHFKPHPLTAKELLIHALFKAVNEDDISLLNQVVDCAEALEKKRGIANLKEEIFKSFNEDGLAALHIATQKGRKAFIQALFAQGANPNCLSAKGIKPIFGLKKLNEGWGLVEGILSLYLEQNVLLTDSDEYNRTLLHTYTTWLGSPSLLSLLLTEETLNQTDKFGNTPLMLACYTQNIAAAHFFLEHGASISNKNEEGLDALDIVKIQRSDDERELKRIAKYRPCFWKQEVSNLKKRLREADSLITSMERISNSYTMSPF